MQPSNNVELRHRFAVARGRGVKRLFERHGIGARGALVAPKSTQSTGRHADVGGINMAIHVEIRLVAMHALANMVGQPAQGEEIRGAIERQRILRTEALTGHYFLMDEYQASIVGFKGVNSSHLE